MIHIEQLIKQFLLLGSFSPAQEMGKCLSCAYTYGSVVLMELCVDVITCW